MALVVWTGTVVAQEPGSCRILGRVVDADLGEGIAGASVWLQRAGGFEFLAGTTTSADGAFSLEVRDCEAVELRTRMIGYTEGFELVEFEGAGEGYQTTVRLDRSPVPVEELRVEVPASLRLQEVGFYTRRAWEESTGRDYGQFYDPEEVEGRSASYRTVTAMARAARLFFIYPRHALCGGPSFYVDGRRIDPRRHDYMRWLDYDVQLEEVEGLEIYRPVHAAIPDEFRDANANLCGLVLVWTKTGGRGEVPRIAVELCEPSKEAGVFTLEGVVTDRVTGVPLPAAYVVLSGAEDGATAGRETVADAGGRYRYCDLDALSASVRARYADAVGPVREVTRPMADSIELDLEVPVIRPGALSGRVVGEGGKQILPDGIVVALDGTDLRASPDSLGFFSFQDIAPGDHVVTVTRRGQLLIRRDVSIRSDDTEQVELKIGG